MLTEPQDPLTFGKHQLLTVFMIVKGPPRRARASGHPTGACKAPRSSFDLKRAPNGCVAAGVLTRGGGTLSIRWGLPRQQLRGCRTIGDSCSSSCQR